MTICVISIDCELNSPSLLTFPRSFSSKQYRPSSNHSSHPSPHPKLRDSSAPPSLNLLRTSICTYRFITVAYSSMKSNGLTLPFKNPSSINLLTGIALLFCQKLAIQSLRPTSQPLQPDTDLSCNDHAILSKSDPRSRIAAIHTRMAAGSATIPPLSAWSATSFRFPLVSSSAATSTSLIEIGACIARSRSASRVFPPSPR